MADTTNIADSSEPSLEEKKDHGETEGHSKSHHHGHHKKSASSVTQSEAGSGTGEGSGEKKHKHHKDGTHKEHHKGEDTGEGGEKKHKHHKDGSHKDGHHHKEHKNKEEGEVAATTAEGDGNLSILLSLFTF